LESTDWRLTFLLTALVPTLVLAAPVRDRTAPTIAVAQYDKARLVDHWLEVAQTPSILSQDCRGAAVDVTTRDDSPMTTKIVCRESSLDDPLLPNEGVLAETDPGIYQNPLELGSL
jgi:hypothetical protein